MKLSVEELASIIKGSTGDTRKALLRKVFEDPENLPLFGKFFFPEAVTTSVPHFHEDIYRRLANPKDEIIAAPRGHAKSTITGLVYLSWVIVNRLAHYIVYVSQNHSKTVQFVEPIRHEFHTNERLSYVYGDLKVGKSDTMSGRDRTDSVDINGIRVEAHSFERNLRGFKYNNHRPSLIILDDIEDDARVHNPMLRDKDARKLNRIIIPSLDPDGHIKMIGTILNVESLLLEKIKQYDGVIYRAIEEDGEPLWPERWSRVRLDQERERIGSSAFESEYMNNPVDSEKAIIKPEWVRACYDENLTFGEREPREYHYLGVDFAFSDRTNADATAFVAIAVNDDTYTLTLLERHHGLSSTEQFELIDYHHQVLDFDDVALEENSIKAVSEKEITLWGFPYTLYWTSSSDPAKKLRSEGDYQGKRHTIGKLAMIDRMATDFENRRVRIPYKTVEDREKAHRLLSELTSWAREGGRLIETGVHPDLPIALGIALERARANTFAFEMVGAE